jgi:hypothetical protein
MKNIKELRESLCQNYNKMRTKKMSIATGKELANTAGKILQSCKVQLDYNQMMNKKNTIEFLES